MTNEIKCKEVCYKSENQLIQEDILKPNCVNVDKTYKPKKLLLQWHITDRCNLRCMHCYQNHDNVSKELDIESLLSIFNQYIALLNKWEVWGHINLTGGEPFIREDILGLLEQFYNHSNVLSYGILSNGLLIDDATAKRLKKLGCKFIQVSLEGGKETNDKIRGQGNFEKVIKSLEVLSTNRIRTLISFSASKLNYLEFPIVAKVGSKYGAQMVWADRIIPTGRGESIKDEMMYPSEVEQFFEIMYACRKKYKKYLFKSTDIPLHRALNFITLKKHEPSGNAMTYRCNAGNGLITIMPDGSLVPCRRMPIVVGNVLEKSIEELYYSSVLLNQLRDKSIVSEGCESCSEKEKCRGGLRCLAYAYYGTPFKADPQCFLIKKDL